MATTTNPKLHTQVQPEEYRANDKNTRDWWKRVTEATQEAQQ